MNFLILILLILFRLDSLWASSSFSTFDYPLDKPAITEYYEKISAFAPVAGIAEKPLPATVEFQLFSGPDNDGRWLGAVAVDGGTPDRYIRSWDVDVVGRDALGCIGYVAINGRLKYPNNPFYSTPLFYSIVAHESVHVHQGIKCLGYGEEETMAELAGWEMLAAHASKWRREAAALDSEAALVYDLRHRFIQTALDLHYRQGKEPKFLERLHLTEAELAYYKALTPGWLAENSVYWTDSVNLLLSESKDDGIIDTNYTQTGKVNLVYLLEYLYAEGILYGK